MLCLSLNAPGDGVNAASDQQPGLHRKSTDRCFYRHTHKGERVERPETKRETGERGEEMIRYNRSDDVEARKERWRRGKVSEETPMGEREVVEAKGETRPE